MWKKKKQVTWIPTQVKRKRNKKETGEHGVEPFISIKSIFSCAVLGSNYWADMDSSASRPINRADILLGCENQR